MSALPPPPPLPAKPITTNDDVTTPTDAEQRLAEMLYDLMSGTGTLKQRASSRAFLLAVISFLPSILAALGQLREVLPPQFAFLAYGLSGVVVVVYIAASRYENVGTTKALAGMTAALAIAKKS